MLAEFLAATAHPAEAQREKLRAILGLNADCAYGREHAFASIAGPGDFRRQVPVVGYDDLRPRVERMMRGEPGVLVSEPVRFFCITSGTTGRAKHIPCTLGFLKDFGRHLGAWYEVFRGAFPGASAPYCLKVVNAFAEGHTEGGIPFGPITRILAWLRGDETEEAIPSHCFTPTDADSRSYAILRFALAVPLRAIIAINPATLVLLWRKLNQWSDDLVRDLHDGTLAPWVQARAEDRQQLEALCVPEPDLARRLETLREQHGELRPAELWPLEGISCWQGGSAGFFTRQLPRWHGPVPLLELGLLASEGAFSTPVTPGTAAGVLAIRSHFFEFIPEEDYDDCRGQPYPPTLLAHELEVGRSYAMLVTGSNGLYRYDMGDVVTVSGRHQATPCVEFVHKAGRMLSITGEKVGEAHVTRALHAALRALETDVAGFSATVRLDGDWPCYLFAVEPAQDWDAACTAALAQRLDLELQSANVEYEQKRRRGSLAPPVLLAVPAGTYERYRARRVAEGASELQVKPPVLFAQERELWTQLVPEDPAHASR